MTTVNLNSTEMSGLKCIPVVVLKNCESELSYYLLLPTIMILSNTYYLIFSICVRWNLVFQIVRMSHSRSLCLKLLGRSLCLKITFQLVLVLLLLKSVEIL